MKLYICFVQTNKIRALYDTEELIETLITNTKYIDDEDILRNTGLAVPDYTELDKKQLRKVEGTGRRAR